MNTDHFAEVESKMKKAGLSEAAIDAFRFAYSNLMAGKTGMIPEASIEAVSELPELEKLHSSIQPDERLLAKTVVLKLNGGLGTSMGLEKAKSLLRVKDEFTFLDFIARQVLFLRKKFKTPLRFMLMNSFSTSEDTTRFLETRYAELGQPKDLELLQNFVPKLDAKTLVPMTWPENAAHEWCPPGHGDLYPSLLGSGWLDRLLKDGVRFMFVSNSDNLGASLDLHLLKYFSDANLGFLMEVCQRTDSDKKGGHLARQGNKLLLRESAQCPDSDIASFQDIRKHRFFNTNNLWIRLDLLKEVLEQNGGFIPLPMIRNVKTVDPRNKKSPEVIQLETAMGAAIETFAAAGAIIVPRNRFAPVKTTADLLALRSDAYEVTGDFRIRLAAQRDGVPPSIDLDGSHYKLVDQLDDKLRGGVPSLVECQELKIKGPVSLSREITVKGVVEIENPTNDLKPLLTGVYQDTKVRL